MHMKVSREREREDDAILGDDLIDDDEIELMFLALVPPRALLLS